MCGKRVCQSAGNSFGDLGDLVHVVGDRQRQHVGLQSVDHGPGLRAGPAVRLFDRDFLASLLLPMLGKFVVELDIQLAGRVVRNVEQRDAAFGSSAEYDVAVLVESPPAASLGAATFGCEQPATTNDTSNRNVLA